MMHIINKRKIYLSISGVFILASIILLFVFGLRLSIEFTGGSRMEVASGDDQQGLTRSKVEQVYSDHEIKVHSIQETERGYRISSEELNKKQEENIVKSLNAKELSFEVLGPTIGGETRNKAFVAVFLAIIAITIYMAIAFRKSGGVVSSWKFGISAILALIHDVIITLGFFSLFGVLFGVEIDALFITAILTLIGFSVHDTIVVFDRIRENITNNVSRLPFEEVVNKSILETIGRSLNTTLTVLFVLFALVLFGGESIRWFVVAFIIGMIVGTYSSIFVASPILVIWHNFDKRGGFKELRKKLDRGRKK